MTLRNSSMFADLPSEFRGARWRPGQDDYARSRAIYNMRTNQAQPALILQPIDAQDVAAAMRFANHTGTPIAVRAGGHGIDGTAMPDGAVVLDLGRLKNVTIDSSAGRVQLGAGVTLGEMDSALEKYRLVVPAGTVSTTGVSGLCLGGGVGYNTRKYGATVDSLLSCEVVTVDGRVVRASETENPDLFWASRGGGGNFGVVTSFEFRTHPLPKVISAAFIPFPLDSASEALLGLRDYMISAPRELCVVGALTECPPLPPVPAEYHAKPVAMFVVVYTGMPAVAERIIHELSALGPALATLAMRENWSTVNRMLDVVAPTGRRVYSKGGYLSDLNEDIVNVAVRHAAKAPPPSAYPKPATVQNFLAMGGAITDDFSEQSTAFSREGAGWLWEAVGQWDSPKDDAAFEAWPQGVHAEMKPYLRSNGYINLTMDQGPQWRRGIWGDAHKYERLVAAKKTWDPHNLLRFNKNIPPKIE
jgi:FAD/FMN-containing dehydrogenase